MSRCPREYSEPVSQPLQLRPIRVAPGLTGVHSKRHFARKRPLKACWGFRCTSRSHRWVSRGGDVRLTCCAGSAAASRGYPSFRRPSRRPFWGMDSVGKIRPDRERWPGIARTTNSCSLKRPAGSSRTMHRHRRWRWLARLRSARVTQERLFAWLPPQQGNAWRANIFQAESAVLILCREDEWRAVAR